MRSFFLFILLSTSISYNWANASDYINFNNFRNSEVVSLASKDGQKRFNKSKYKGDFVRLAPNFQPQINPLYCGIATSAIILNSIFTEDRPNQPTLSTQFPSEIGNKMIEFNLYSQLTLLNDDTDLIKNRDIIEFKSQNNTGKYDPGLTLLNLKSLLEFYGVNAELNYIENKVADIEIRDFRNNLKLILNDDNKFLIVNFLGKSYGATTGGHITPIAAYNKKTDSVLLLDVASHKNPWYWVNIELLYQAMNTKDGDNYRGYLVVSR